MILRRMIDKIVLVDLKLNQRMHLEADKNQTIFVAGSKSAYNYNIEFKKRKNIGNDELYYILRFVSFEICKNNKQHNHQLIKLHFNVMFKH